MTEPVLPVEPVGRAVGATATLSFVGGFVDVVGFIALFGLFTAHVTGNFIMLGLEMVHATKLAIAKLLVPAILAFTAGALLGAYAYVTFSFWYLIIPIVALLAVAWMVAAKPAVSA
jgi:uncharacterized membrane protein YoaK (UPF0700 family)